MQNRQPNHLPKEILTEKAMALHKEGLAWTAIGTRFGISGRLLRDRANRAQGGPKKNDPWWDQEDRTSRFIKLWGDGLSDEEIARDLGTTKRAVCGKRFRFGLQARRRQGGPQPKSLLPKSARQRKFAPHFNPEPYIEVPHVEIEPAGNGQVKLLDLTWSMCRWPYGDPLDPGFHFCGRRKTLIGSYCEHHKALASGRAA